MVVLVHRRTEQVFNGVRFNGASTHAHVIKAWLAGEAAVPQEGGVHTADMTSFQVASVEGFSQVQPGNWVIKHRERVLVLTQEAVADEYLLAHDEAFAIGVIESANNLIPYFQDENSYCAVPGLNDDDLESYKTGAIWESLYNGVAKCGDKDILRIQDSLAATRNTEFEKRVMADPVLVAQLEAATSEEAVTRPARRRSRGHRELTRAERLALADPKLRQLHQDFRDGKIQGFPADDLP